MSAKNRQKKKNIYTKKKVVKKLFRYHKASRSGSCSWAYWWIRWCSKKISFQLFEKQKHVVTANKALISKHGDALSKLAEKNKVNLEFEAAVAGGIPIIRSLKEGLITNKINKIHGILNGTSNYILSKMLEKNMNFADVLDDAKN